MARYRFAWTNLPPAVLRALKRDLELEGDASAVLRKTYGARPGAAFVEDAWPTLREHWLTRDRVARSSVIASLRDRRLGDPSIATRSNAGQLDYLRSCRNAGTLREIVAKALVTAGETSSTPPSKPRSKPHQILSSVLEMLQRVSGNPELSFDDDGDIPLRYGSTMVFVQAFGDPPVIRVSSPVLRQVAGGADVDGAVAQLNRDSVFIKWVAAEGTLYASIDLFGSPLQLDHVLNACGVVGGAADDLDEQLQERLGGSTFFGEFKPRPLAIGGYL